MAQSMNSSVEYTVRATSFHGLAVYGSVMVGNNAFEFYNERNPEDYVQIPWTEIDHVAAEVIGGRHIPRFAIITKEHGAFKFSTRDNKATLRAVREHVGEENIVRSKSFFDVVKYGLQGIWNRLRGK